MFITKKHINIYLKQRDTCDNFTVSVSLANTFISFTIVFVILVELKHVRLSYAQISY